MKKLLLLCVVISTILGGIIVGMVEINSCHPQCYAIVEFKSLLREDYNHNDVAWVDVLEVKNEKVFHDYSSKISKDRLRANIEVCNLLALREGTKYYVYPTKYNGSFFEESERSYLLDFFKKWILVSAAFSLMAFVFAIFKLRQPKK